MKPISRLIATPALFSWGSVALALLLLVPMALAEEPPVIGIHSGKEDQTQHGVASWHLGTNHTASGKPWISEDFVAAHRSLPLGSRVRVVNLSNGRSTVVRIIDRGPYAHGRVIDLSRAAAREIGLLDSGIGKVRLENVPPEPGGHFKAAKPSA